MRCPNCDAKLKRMITDDPYIDHQLSKAGNAPNAAMIRSTTTKNL